ncbi:U3 small nucleolar RNA-associated protein 10 [Podosphaera aphanis]|nr:U3 small nucleolar RNA-associated protein 10 [Podosphaera aphanis]
MATSLAAQLSVIATNSEHSLNLKALKARHSKSLIFDPRIAASQNIEAIYVLCSEGFQELCLLDRRFLEFQNDIFSEQSPQKDRSQMTAAQNKALDVRLEAFLSLVSGKLRLSPAIKAVEWLVRRFRIHEFNASFLLLTFLPYHTLPIFTTILSILPQNIPLDFKFLNPYVRSLTIPPRQAIVQAATSNVSFTASFSSYILKTCKIRCQYPALLAFWAGIMTEAISYMLDKAKSGRKTANLQNEQDIALRILPILRDCLGLKGIPELHIASYMVLSVFASKGQLDEKLLTAMMEEVAIGLTDDTIMPGIVCLSLLAQHRGAKQLTKRLTKYLTNKQNIAQILIEVSQQRRVDKIANGLCLALIERLKKNADVSGLPLIKRIVDNRILSESQVTVIIKALILVAYQMNEIHFEARSLLAKFLVDLTELSGDSGSISRKAFRETEVDIDELELKLHTSFRKPFEINESFDLKLESASGLSKNPTPNLTSILDQLPKNVVEDISFLSPEAFQTYSKLSKAFLLCTPDEENLKIFNELPILSQNRSSENANYFSFYMYIWCGPHPVSVRVYALQLATRCLSADKSGVDFQAILPYAIAALNDPSAKVRRGAVEILQAINNTYVSISSDETNKKKAQVWAVKNIYGIDKEKSLNWMPTSTASRLLSEIIIPNLEECALDRNHIESVFQKSFDTHRNSETSIGNRLGNLSQSSRSSIFSFLASQITYTPLLTVKSRLLAYVNQVRSIGSSTRTRFLLPALKDWSLLSQDQVTNLCVLENLEVQALEDQYLNTLTPKDEEGVRFLHTIIQIKAGNYRPTFINGVFKRLEQLWPSLKSNLKSETADILLVAIDPTENTDKRIISEAAIDLLQKVTLTTDILLRFLDGLPSAAELMDTPPAKKRRRTSNGDTTSTSINDSKSFLAVIQRMTLVLKLVESSEPEKHPELLKALFNILAELQHFKALVASELAYLQGLVLGSLLAILKTFRSNSSLKIDSSAVRPDLLVECVQKSTSPQVQNAALLLISSLAHTAPQLVFYSVMPIFTFMRNSTLQQNDEYSAHVINQTIREVIPPIIASLRLENIDPITGAAELLLSFVAAYEHVPSHRRKGLFLSLVQTLGPQDFLFALTAMLADKYTYSDSIRSFSVEICGSFSAEVQLQTAIKYISLISDILSPNPNHSSSLLNINDESGTNPHLVAQCQLSLLSRVLSQDRLIAQVGKLLARDSMDSTRLRELYSKVLELTLALADSLKEHKSLYNACGDVVESILGLLSTPEFLKSIEGLLDKPDESLRRKILRSFEIRMDKERSTDTVSRLAMLGFLPQLITIIRDSQDVRYQEIAVSCVEKISKKFGRKDVEAVAAAAEIIANSYCLGQTNNRLRVTALLCLASMVEIIGAAIIPVLPVAIQKSFEYMKGSMQPEAEVKELHCGCYTFFSALAQNLPYLITGPYLDKLLEISSESAETLHDAETVEIRTRCLSFIAKNIDGKYIFSSLERKWPRALSSGSSALLEYLHVLGLAIDYHPKVVIGKNSSNLEKILKNTIDLRRQVQTIPGNLPTKNEINEIESIVNKVALKMIYKLNDATFRPMFENLTEWAATGLPKSDKSGRILRLQSFYGFTTIFFENLKSIVTSYASYFIDNAVKILNSVDLKDDASKELWSRVIQTLARCFEHDQDDFWQSPSHFDAVATTLCSQIVNVSNLPEIKELVSSIVKFASAADSSDHHKQLNMGILKHMRSEVASVRLASVKCEQELTDKLGEEWLSMLPEMLPFISELQEDDDEVIEKETHRWIVKIEEVLGESLDSMLQ